MSDSARRRKPNEGSVLLLAVIAVTAMSFMTVGVIHSIREQVQISSLDSHALRAEFAAESGIGFMARQVRGDSAWAGTAGQWLELGDQAAFRLTRLSADATGEGGMALRFLSEGRHGEALTKLETQVTFHPADPILRNALVLLGGSNVVHRVEVNGDMLLADEVGFVNEFVPDPDDPMGGGWQPGGASAIDTVELEYVDVSDGLYKFTDNQYLPDGCPETQLTEPINAPGYVLDEYLVPGPDRIIMDRTGQGNVDISGVSIEETVVVKADPGVRINVHGADLKGGLVIYAEPGYDVRNGARNLLQIYNPTTRIGIGTNGAYENLGVLAPACKVKSWSCPGYTNVLQGFNAFGSLELLDEAEVYGQLIVTDDTMMLKRTRVEFDQNVAENPPGGIRFFGAGMRMELDYVKEAFDPLPQP